MFYHGVSVRDETKARLAQLQLHLINRIKSHARRERCLGGRQLLPVCGHYRRALRNRGVLKSNTLQ